MRRTGNAFSFLVLQGSKRAAASFSYRVAGLSPVRFGRLGLRSVGLSGCVREGRDMGLTPLASVIVPGKATLA